MYKIFSAVFLKIECLIVQHLFTILTLRFYANDNITIKGHHIIHNDLILMLRHTIMYNIKINLTLYSLQIEKKNLLFCN